MEYERKHGSPLSRRSASQVVTTGPQLSTAVDGTSSNSNAVATWSTIADPAYDQSQMQILFDQLDQLILALRR